MSQQSHKIRQIPMEQKREMMWNVIEPGDPYDIRKSMIAKLPGQSKFMGPHLELVCLLQAAEIERLCQYLDQYRLKLRQNERVPLDRHSYEIQIRELTQKLASEQGSKIENQKLKDFIRKQTKELEEVQRLPQMSDLAAKYENSLTQIDQLVKENQDLRQNLEFSKAELLKISNKIHQVEETKNKELEMIQYKLNVASSSKLQAQKERERIFKSQESQTKQKLDQQVSTLKQYETRFFMLAEELERLNVCLRGKSKELNEQYVLNQQLKEEKQYCQQQNVEQQTKIKNLCAELVNLENKNRDIIKQKSGLEQRQTLIRQYESRIQKLSMEVDRLNNVLRKKINQLDEFRKKAREQELTITSLGMAQKETDQLRAKFSEVSKKIFEYEKQNTVQNQQIDRLNFTLKRMINEVNQAEAKIKNSQKQIDQQVKKCIILETDLQQQIQAHKELKQTDNSIISQLKEENEDLREKLQSYQSIYQENRVLRSELNRAIEEKEELYKEITYSKSKSQKELEHEKQNVSNLKQIIEEHESQIEELKEDNFKVREESKKKLQQKDVDSQMESLKQEIVRINSEKLSLTDSLNKFSYEKEGLLKENEDQKKKLDDMGQYYKKVIIFSDEINRLNSVLQTKEKQIQQYHDSLVEYRSKIQYFEDNINTITNELQSYRRQPSPVKTQDYENRILLLQSQLEKSRSQDEKLLTYQSKITVIGEQIERLNRILRDKVQRIENLEAQVKTYAADNEQLKQKGRLSIHNDQHIRQYQRRLIQQKDQLNRLVEIIKQKDIHIIRVSEEHRLEVDRLNRLIFANQEQIQSIEQKDQNYLSQIQRLNNLLRIKIEECQAKSHEQNERGELINELKDELNVQRKEKDRLNVQLVKAKSQMKSYQQKIKELYEEFERLQVVMNTLKQQNKDIQSFKDRINELIQKNRWLGGEINRLNATIDEQNQELTEIRSKIAEDSTLQRRVNEDLSLMVVLFAEIESLRVRILQKDNQIIQIRKQNVNSHLV